MLRVPFKVAVGIIKLTSLALKSAEKPWLHSWPMEIRLRSPKARKMFDCWAPKGSRGNGKRAVWDAQIDDPLGRPTRMTLYVEDLLVHGVVEPRKWLVQLESTMARVLGTKVRGAVMFATFSLYLVPSHSQLGLFLAEPPFVSAFVAPLSCPVLGFSQSRLEWFEE